MNNGAEWNLGEFSLEGDQEEIWRNCTKTTSDFEGRKLRSISLFMRHSCFHNETRYLTSTHLYGSRK